MVRSASEDLNVIFILNAFRQGRDTVDISKQVNMKEEVVERLLHVGLDIKRLEKIREGKR